MGARAELLSVEKVSVSFGGVLALDEVCFTVAAGEICSIIGPNGAGKTTLFNCLSRLAPFKGAIYIDGAPVHALPPHQLASVGLGRTFQNVALFPSLTVEQNIQVGLHHRIRPTFLREALRLGRVAQADCVAVEFEGYLKMLDLEKVRHRFVGEVTFAVRKRIEFARALAMRPRLLLLDEPAAGLNHSELATLQDVIRRCQRDLGCAVLLVEHNMDFVMTLSDRIVVLNFGQKIAEGRPDDIRRNPIVAEAYLGTPP